MRGPKNMNLEEYVRWAPKPYVPAFPENLGS